MKKKGKESSSWRNLLRNLDSKRQRWRSKYRNRKRNCKRQRRKEEKKIKRIIAATRNCKIDIKQISEIGGCNLIYGGQFLNR